MNVIFLILGAVIVVGFTVFGIATFFDRYSATQADARKWRALQKQQKETE